MNPGFRPGNHNVRHGIKVTCYARDLLVNEKPEVPCPFLQWNKTDKSGLRVTWHSRDILVTRTTITHPMNQKKKGKWP